MAQTQNNDVSGWVGWLYFAGLLMMLAGIFQSIAGLVALLKDEVYVVSSSNLLVLNLTQWGWAHIALGIILILSSLSLMAGQAWGRFLAAFLAAISAVANFAFITVYPIWAIMVIAIDVFIIYAVLVHGGEVKRYRDE